MSCSVVTNNPSVTYFKTEVIDNEDNIDDSMDVLDQCDASTVVNVSLRDKEKKKIVRKRKREPETVLDNVSTISEIPAPQAELTEDITDQSLDRVVKVVSWLERSLFASHDESDNVEESFVTENWLDGNPSNPSLNPSLRKNIRRVRVFLLEVEPSPDNEPLDLVSGYCYDGCKRFSAYSTVVWSQQDSYDIPLCHNCAKTDIEKELRLMFKFKLRVMDPNGAHADFNVWKEHGEEFFGCSTEDFIRKWSVREAAVAPLRQYSVANTMDEYYTPLLDLNLVCVKDFFFVVNSRLKQANKSRKIQDVTDLSEQTQVNKSISDY